VRSANLMDLAAGLPLEADRTDMRGLMYQSPPTPACQALAA
jgi:hypothetical protein